MEQIGIRALKQNASAVVARAAAGESLVITDRGRPVAQLVPLHESILERLVAEGSAVAPTRRLSELPAPADGSPITPALQRMRDEERY
ncbi:MAG TPA: type II toxin-antitoxin system prevent-host-death family antitoxin [Protaetiibacter sp.]|jgi:prevent-host-death family protein|nr:type II toxin-antitoxin system prevent-host-death family antitoxin [Protaetiibacter sp.]